MDEHRQLRLTLQTENAARLSREKERELIEALADLILAAASANNRNTSAHEHGGGDERKDS
jgi:hypothetical protein